jgi:hypothetical protein
MFIQEFSIVLGDFEDSSAQPADDALGREQVIAFNAILIGVKLDSDHGIPPS